MICSVCFWSVLLLQPLRWPSAELEQSVCCVLAFVFPGWCTFQACVAATQTAQCPGGLLPAHAHGPAAGGSAFRCSQSCKEQQPRIFWGEEENCTPSQPTNNILENKWGPPLQDSASTFIICSYWCSLMMSELELPISLKCNVVCVPPLWNQVLVGGPTQARAICLSKPKPPLVSYPRPHPLPCRSEWHTRPPWRYPCGTVFTFLTIIPLLWKLISHFAWFWPLQSSSLKRPIIPIEFGAKIPTNIRQRYLNTFIDECVKFCPSEDVAFQMVGRAAGLPAEGLVWSRLLILSFTLFSVSGPWWGEAGVWSQ